MKAVTMNLYTRKEAIELLNAEANVTNKELAEILAVNAEKDQVNAVLGARGKISVAEGFTL